MKGEIKSERRPRSPFGGRLSVGAEKRAAVKYRKTKVRRKVRIEPVTEIVASKVGAIVLPLRMPKVRLNANGVLEPVVNAREYETHTAVRA